MTLRSIPFGSIRTQLQLLAGLSAATALAIASAVFVTNDMWLFDEHKRKQMHTYAGVIGLNVMPGLEQEDAESVSRVFDSLRLEPTIVAACVYKPSGEVFVAYQNHEYRLSDYPAPEAQAWVREHEQGQLGLFKRLNDRRGKHIGSLYMRFTRDDVNQQVSTYALGVASILGFSLIAAGTLAHRLNSAISGPLEELVDAANHVRERGDYSVRVGDGPGGDLSDLCQSFNAMLDQVELSNEAVRCASAELNDRVLERTKELRHEVQERRGAEAAISGQNLVLKLLATGESIETVLDTLLHEVQTRLGQAVAAIVRVQEDAQRLSGVVGGELPSRLKQWLEGMPIEPRGPAPARALATLKPHEDSPVEAWSGPAGTGEQRACQAAPIVASNGTALGVMVVFLPAGATLTHDQRRTLGTAVSLASIAIEQRYSEEALKRAIEQATASSQAKSEFLANMSHEIRTPLNAILGFTDLMRTGEEKLSNAYVEHLETIASSGRHLQQLIDDVLDLSKVEAGEMTIEKTCVDPNLLLAEVASLLRVRAVQRGISLDYEWITESPGEVETDPSRLRQLMVNLVGNAIKFTEHGGVRIVASVEGDLSDAHLRIDVIDTGIGIPRDKLRAVFEPFAQADSSVTRRFGGTGLGLAISSQITTSLGGELSVSSELGLGSRFTFRLPIGCIKDSRSVSQPINDAVQLCAESNDASPTSRLDGLRVLVVDDGETNRRLVGLILRRAGAEIEMVENGRKAVEAAMTIPFDVVLMDMQMPEMDGYTATRRLREAGVHTPVIALTAHAMKGDEQKCLEAGCSGYLSKPIDAAKLTELLAGVSPHGAGGDSRVALDACLEDKEPIASSLPTDDEEFAELVMNFLEKLRSILAETRAAVDRGDWPTARDHAHWLKGSGGTAGYAVLTQLGKNLEASLGDEPDPGEVNEALRAIERIQDRLEAPARLATT